MRLTPREFEVLSHLAEGLPDKVIATRMGISRKTIGAHLQSIYRNSAATLARRLPNGILTMPRT